MKEEKIMIEISDYQTGVSKKFYITDLTTVGKLKELVLINFVNLIHEKQIIETIS